jgi:Ca-activated chloride channel family protein
MLEAPAECRAGEEVRIEWTGPDNRGDYITIVRAGTPDGHYAKYRETRHGTPLMVEAPDEAGEAEIRYVAGQGNVVLARRAIRVVP